MLKKCSKCHKEKELFDFRKDKTHSDGLSSNCKACRKDAESSAKAKSYREEYDKKNREHILELRRKNRAKPENKLKAYNYYLSNREYINLKSREWRANNPEKKKNIAKRSNSSEAAKERKKRFNEKHKDEIKLYMQEYRQRPEVHSKALIRNLNRHYLKKTNGEKITREELELLKVQQNNKCFYCNNTLTIFHQDHIIPLNKGGEHRIVNIVLSCPKCNCSKKDSDPEEFVNKILERKAG